MLDTVVHLRDDRDQRIALSHLHVNPLKWMGMAFLGLLTLISIAVVHVEHLRAAAVAITLFRRCRRAHRRHRAHAGQSVPDPVLRVARPDRAARAARPVNDTAPVTRHLRITGRVQGVGYRWNMARQATALGLGGWVRNRLDGSVEALAMGPVDAVRALIDWAQRGPELARVDGVEVTEGEGGEVLVGFEQRETV